MSTQKLIYKWVKENFGKSEAEDPSWNIEELANYIDEHTISKDTLDKWLDILNYWFEHVEDYAERYPDMAPMVKKFDKMIDEMYNVWKNK
jgi:hypothetical protein